MAHTHPDQEAHRLLQFQEPDACVGAEFYHLAAERKEQQKPLIMYTDGSCLDPRYAATRRAAFAVVVDLCDSDEQRCQHAMQYLATGRTPESLQPLAMSRVTCEQTVPRAELSALEIATGFDVELQVYSDSQYALGVVDKLRTHNFGLE